MQTGNKTNHPACADCDIYEECQQKKRAKSDGYRAALCDNQRFRRVGDGYVTKNPHAENSDLWNIWKSAYNGYFNRGCVMHTITRKVNRV